jgi:glycosyltransferase involved in cell wall biosynthesis
LFPEKHMLKALLPTFERQSFNGGVARYIRAITLTYPNSVRVADLPMNAKYADIFPLFWKENHKVDEYFISHILPLGTVAWILSFMGGKPYVIFLHGTDFDLARRNPWKKFLTRNILKRAKRVVTNSDALKSEVEAFVQLKAPALTIYPTVSDDFVKISSSVRHGSGKIDLKELAKLAVGAAGGPVILKNSGSDKPLTLLTVARLVERKGHLKVLEALASLPNIRYTIIGDGPYKNEIQKTIEKLGLTDRVFILSDVKDEDLPKLYAESDIFIMPATKTETDREGFGIVYLEAGLFALPVIAVKQPGVDEAILDEQTGILVEDNPVDLLIALKRLSEDSGLRARMGSKGRTRVLEIFTREEQMKNVQQLLM